MLIRTSAFHYVNPDHITGVHYNCRLGYIHLNLTGGRYIKCSDKMNALAAIESLKELKEKIEKKIDIYTDLNELTEMKDIIKISEHLENEENTKGYCCTLL